MKQLQLINDDWSGHAEHLRHACRGILIRDGRILLSHEARNDIYMLPGGGLEEGETLKECCEREVLEETGIAVQAGEYFLKIEELFTDWRHINHYFVCEFIRDTGVQKLTEGEKRAGYRPVWLPVREALDLLGDYERYRPVSIALFGLYRREHAALQEYLSASQKDPGSDAG